MMRISDFDYELPPDRIAQTAAGRGLSRLLTLPASGANGHRQISDLPDLLDPGDLLVVNNTRVLAARIFGRRPGGGHCEVLLVEPRALDESVVDATHWICLGRPRKRMKPGTRLAFRENLDAEVVDHLPPDRLELVFTDPPVPHLNRIGHVPLPPYIARDDVPDDRERYQTVYAEVPGAVAAPTAGLHFDHDLLAAVRSRGVEIARITLHVGPGTFRPMTSENVEDHHMEMERFEVDVDAAKAIAATRERGGCVIAVGTTVVRTLEAVALAGAGHVEAQTGSTDLFIRPGFDFQIVDRLLTNFHLPRSTLLVLVSALAGRERVLDAYREAVSAGYRFYSYGDAMLVDRGR